MKNYLILLLFLTFQIVFGQSAAPLVKIGDYEISQEEYKFRFELSPRAGGSADNITQKEQFLYTLISEKLWALEAANTNLINDQYLKNYLSIIEKMYVRDALFNEEIQNKIVITKEEIEKDLTKINAELEIKFLFSENKNEIDSLYEILLKGENFDSLLTLRPEKREQQENIKVVYGQVDAEKENILFSLSENNYSIPIKENIGWVIYYLNSTSPSPLVSEMDNEKKQKAVKEVLENRKKKFLFDNYIKDLYGNQVINVDKDLFRKLLGVLTEVIFKKCASSDCDKNEKLILYESDFLKIKSYFSDKELKTNYVKFVDNPVNLNYFLDNLSFNEFRVEAVSEKLIERALNGCNREFITLELITRDAYIKNYGSGKLAQSELNLWRDNYLSQSLKNRFIDSARVSDDEAYEYFLKSKNDSSNALKLKVIELYTKDLQIVEIVLNKISEGEDFRKLAAQFSERKNAENFNYELTLKNYNDFPEIREAASSLNIGELGGPVKIGNGYSIFQLIEKENFTDIFADTFETEKENIKQKLFYEKIGSIIKRKTIELAKKYNLEVNEDLLNKVKTTEINALVYRHFGFGGRILAAPFLNMFYEWYEDYKKEISGPL
ncbi:MAG: peptidylprolyl isomerase [Bacteroidetes bacterium]|nr:peptidylprolyl isomerase [Bacteroidota bacterium]